MACALYRHARGSFPEDVGPGKVVVLTPYRNQVSELRRAFQNSLPPEEVGRIAFSTVDGFQGREMDVVILSCVRASRNSRPGGGIGFLADVRRMNVALTRARKSLWVLGHVQALERSPHWAALVRDARERGVLYPAQRPYHDALRTAAAQPPAPPRLGSPEAASAPAPEAPEVPRQAGGGGGVPRRGKCSARALRCRGPPAAC
mmetsp:Transcript_30611/g.97725  ORF Transcript_30611/g.97725 Transcript_30611/m.97725 type:complete len:203 (+) Transcript_30611:254-862(+)